jgi:DNA-binding NarL/FixJ family response regulator
MDNNTRFNIYTKAIQQFISREGHARVPAIHVEIVDGKEVRVGAWVGYIRQRAKKGILSAEKRAALDAIPGWQWGPLKPGPATNHSRNSEILSLREKGMTLRQIADSFDLSRQRVHQIVKKANV